MKKCECGAELKVRCDMDDEDDHEDCYYYCPECHRTSYYPGFY